MVAPAAAAGGRGGIHRRRAEDRIGPLGVEALDALQVCIGEDDLGAGPDHGPRLAEGDGPTGEEAAVLGLLVERLHGVEVAVGRDERVERVERSIGVPEGHVGHVVEAGHLADVVIHPPIGTIGVALDRGHQIGVVEGAGEHVLLDLRAAGDLDLAGEGGPGRRRGRLGAVEVPVGQLGGEVSQGAVGGDERDADLHLDGLRGGVEREGESHGGALRRGAGGGGHAVVPDLRVLPRRLGARGEVDVVSTEAARHPTHAVQAPRDEVLGGVELEFGVGDAAAAQVMIEVEDDAGRAGAGRIRVAVVGAVDGGGDLGLDVPLVEGDTVEAGGADLGGLVEV